MTKKILHRYDRGEIKGKAMRTDEGYIRANAVATRTGVFLYQNPDGTIRRELRHPDDVFSKESLDSLKMIPVTNGHPEAMLVNAENAKDLSIGNTGEEITIDGAHLMTTLVITHKDGVDSVDAGRKELSLGYMLELEKAEGEYNGERYDYRQRNIRYNHLAIVDRARAGSAASLNIDSSDAMQIDAAENQPNPTEENEMPTIKVTLDGIQYDAAPEVANALSKANSRADALESKLKEAADGLEKAKADMSKLEAERDTLKEQAEKNADGDSIKAAVRERLDLERKAAKILNGDDAKEIANMDDREIKEKCIEAKFPKAALDGKDDSYIDARFDSVSEMVEGESTAADQKAAMGERNDGSAKQNDSEKSRADASDFLKNMHKKEAK